MSLHVAGALRLPQSGFAVDVDIEASDGEVVALLGPNGAGKTTLLRVIAGLAGLDRGSVRLGDVVLDDPDRGNWVAAQQRRLGVVFQDHRLFGHLRVVDNVAFGLRARGVGRRDARERALGWLSRMGIGELASRRPSELSGGQAQRVALARALACQPAALLLDEPLAALDVQTRAQIQGELRAHLRSFAGPTVLVSHDPVEALLLADRFVVLEQGRVAQSGSPAEVTARPLTPYVAHLVGVNLYPGHAVDDRIELDAGGTLSATGASDGRVLVAVRPSSITLLTEAPHGSSARNLWLAQITALVPLGDRVRVITSAPLEAKVDVTAAAVAELGLVPGRRVWLSAKATDVSAYPAP